jgi:hypothetical protein
MTPNRSVNSDGPRARLRPRSGSPGPSFVSRHERSREAAMQQYRLMQVLDSATAVLT